MRLTKSQEKLRSLALERADKGLTSEVVLCESYAGVSTLVRRLTRDTQKPGPKGARVIGLNAIGAWDALTSLSSALDLPVNCGLGYTGSADRSFEHLRKAGWSDLTLLLEDAHLMDTKDLEKLIVTLEWAAHRRDLNTRALLLLGRVSRWNYKSVSREIVWPRLPDKFFHKDEPRRWPPERIIQFTRDNLKELRASQIPEELFGDTPQVGKVAVA